MRPLHYIFLFAIGGLSLLVFLTSDTIHRPAHVAQIADELGIPDDEVGACFAAHRPTRPDATPSQLEMLQIGHCLQSAAKGVDDERLALILEQNRPGLRDR